MSIFTKVLLGLVLIAAFPAIYLAAGVLSVHGAWRTKVAEFETALKAKQEANKLLEFGSDEARSLPYIPGKPLQPGQTLGVNQLEVARNTLLYQNGRIWYATRVTPSINPELGTVKMVVYDNDFTNVNFGGDPASGGRKELKEEKEHGITNKMTVFVFSMKHSGERSPTDRYIGEFVVDGLIETNIPLKPSRPFTAEQWEKLREGDGQWIVRDQMPSDVREAFIGMEEKDIRDRVPAEVVVQYLNDNQPPSEAILADETLSKFVVGDEKTGKKFLRPLNDYQEIFRTADRQLDEMKVKLQVEQGELAFAKTAEKNAMAISEGLDMRKTKLEADKVMIDEELKVVKEHSEKLAVAVEQMKQELSRLLEENKARRLGKPPAAGKTAAMPAVEAGAALGSD